MSEKLSPVQNQYPGREEAERQVEAFAANPAFDALAEAYHAVLPTDASERLQVLTGLAAREWDSRKNPDGTSRERQDINWLTQQVNNDPVKAPAIKQAATTLGYVEASHPVGGIYDAALISGAANLSCETRTRYALEQLIASGSDVGMFIGLPGMRKMTDDEKEKTKEVAPGAETEYDLMCAAFSKLPDAHLVSHDDGMQRARGVWAWQEFEFQFNGKPRRAFVLNTPERMTAADNTGRPKSHDNFALFAHMAGLGDPDGGVSFHPGGSGPQRRFLNVTAALYLFGQHFPAVQELTLPYGAAVETIGYDAAYAGSPERTASALLQEIKAGVDAAARLQRAIDQAKAA